MKDFWKEEVNLFKQDVENLWDFLFQPVTMGDKKDDTLALRPNEDEIISKAQAIENGDESVAGMSKASEGFWNREFDLLKQDVTKAWDFLFQPVTFKK
ncbi:MAG: hypothetical protein IJ809_04425 [Clostridia bacterium]|nr:hypothetical protein [Clostridia bacterium]